MAPLGLRPVVAVEVEPQTQRFVLYSERDGVYLGNALGLCLFTKVDPAGQEAAVTFASAEAALAHKKTMKTPPLDLEPRVVLVGAPKRYATVDECVAAGLPEWDPNAEMKVPS